MGNPRIHNLIAAMMVTAAIGCAHRGAPRPAPPPELSLPAVQRGSVEQSILRLPSAPDPNASPDPFPNLTYRMLSARQAQCLAAANAPVARLQLAETRCAVRRGGRAEKLRRDILAYTAEEVQNRAAGGALELYFRIAEVEGKTDLLDEGLKQLDFVIKETRDLVARSLRPPVALDVWERQALQMRADRLQAQMTIDQLNGDLRSLVGIRDGCEHWRVWNPDGYEVTDAAVDVETAVCEGLAHRPELSMLRRLLQDFDADTLPVVCELLRSLHPLLGSDHRPPHALLMKIAAHCHIGPVCRDELDQRRRQLADYLAQRERAVGEEIRQAATALVYRGRIVALAWERERKREQNVNDVRSRQRQGLASFAEAASIVLEWQKARAEVIQEVMAWHVAQAKLRQSQGILAAECSQPSCAFAR